MIMCRPAVESWLHEYEQSIDNESGFVQDA